MSGSSIFSISPSRNKCRVQQVFGDKLKVEEKIQVLNALISACDQKIDDGHSENCPRNELSKKSKEQVNYKCAVCSKSFLNLSQYYGHLQKHRGEDFSWICSKCPDGMSAFKSLKHLRKHEKSSHSTKIHQCTLCKDTFTQSSGKTAHIIQSHSEQTRFSCQFCDKGFYKRSDLRTHLATHLSLQRSVCEVCGRSFSHISNLIRHSYLHTGVKPYPCKLCGKRFTQLSSLKQHKISQHENLSIPCPALPQQCAKVFSTPVLARTHAFRVHPDISWENPVSEARKQRQTRNFYCRNCGEAFQFAKDLKKHNLSHENSDKAGFGFTSNSLDDDDQKLSLASTLDTEEQVNNLADDIFLTTDLKDVESSTEALLASISIDCNDAFDGDMELDTDLSTDILENHQQILLSTAESSESYDVMLPYPVDHQPSGDLILEEEHDTELTELQCLNIKEIEVNHHFTELMEDDEDANELSHLHYLRVGGRSPQLTELQGLIGNEDEQCSLSPGTHCGIKDESNGMASYVNDPQNLNRQEERGCDCQTANLEHSNNQKDNESDSHLTELQCLNIQNENGLDNELPALKCLNTPHETRCDNQSLEFQCLNLQDCQNPESFGSNLVNNSCATMLNEKKQSSESDFQVIQTSDSCCFTMEFSDEIISLLPETRDCSGEIVIYVSQEDGAPAKVCLKPVLTSVITSDSADLITAAEDSTVTLASESSTQENSLIAEEDFLESSLNTSVLEFLSQGKASPPGDEPCLEETFTQVKLLQMVDEPSLEDSLNISVLESLSQGEALPAAGESSLEDSLYVPVLETFSQVKLLQMADEDSLNIPVLESLSQEDTLPVADSLHIPILETITEVKLLQMTDELSLEDSLNIPVSESLTRREFLIPKLDQPSLEDSLNASAFEVFTPEEYPALDSSTLQESRTITKQSSKDSFTESASNSLIKRESSQITEGAALTTPLTEVSSKSFTEEEITPQGSIVLKKTKNKKPNRTKRMCPECGRMFFKASNLTQHLGTHFPNMQGYKCEVCNQSFAWKSSLNKHMIAVHKVVIKQFLCDLCGKQYHNSYQVKEHKKRDHQSLRPHTCTICNKSFYRKYDLHIHHRIHTNQKPFMCDICGKTFNHLSHVKRHERVHQHPRITQGAESISS